MDSSFWLSRWQEGRIGFHQDRPTPLLVEHWPSLGVAPGGRVFVPLCGKSLDMAWLASQGLRVLGVELSATAVEAFFHEHDLVPGVRDSPCGRHYVAGGIEIVCGDAFALDASLLGDCDAVFDRAALIALPEDMRRRYVAEIHGKLPGDCRGLLVTLDYPPDQKAGPPFAVTDDEVHALFDPLWDVTLRSRHDVLEREPAFRAEGLTALSTAAYALQRR